MSSNASPSAPRRLVLVAGSGRSGTSTIAGVLKTLGLHVPQPEVPGSRSNPRGHFEPRWAVDFQKALLERANVVLSDARPHAFEKCARIGLRPAVQQQLQEWLGEQATLGSEIVVKDPRNSWLLPMWRESARALDLTPGSITMLRHPTEVVSSKSTYYYKKESDERRRVGETSRMASWVNVSLLNEYWTRGWPRVFIRYEDLLADWRSAVSTTAAALDLSMRNGVKPEVGEEVDRFVDPSLHRVRVGWGDLDVPPALQELAEEVWQGLNRLADGGGQDPAAEEALDKARTSYEQMYHHAYAVANSSIQAEARSAVRRARRRERRRTAQARDQPPRGSGGGVDARASGARPHPARVLARGAASRARAGLRRLVPFGAVRRDGHTSPSRQRGR